MAFLAPPLRTVVPSWSFRPSWRFRETRMGWPFLKAPSYERIFCHFLLVSHRAYLYRVCLGHYNGITYRFTAALFWLQLRLSPNLSPAPLVSRAPLSDLPPPPCLRTLYRQRVCFSIHSVLLRPHSSPVTSLQAASPCFLPSYALLCPFSST